MLCFFQADCEFDVKFGADHEHHKCACKTGWTGNGVQVLMRIPKNSGVSKFSFYNIFQLSVFRLDNWRGKCGNGGHIKVQTTHRLLSSTFLLGFLTLALTKQRTDYYQNISRWFPDYSLVQRGREPDDGGEQQVLRLSSQL